MENIVSKLKEYLEFIGVSVSVAEQKIGVSNASLSKPFKNQTTIKTDTLEKFLKVYSDISPEWLLTGKGDMLKNNIKIEDMVNEPEMSYRVIKDSAGIPLIPIKAMAGFGEGESAVLEVDCERFVVPTFKGADFLITVKGSSMQPKYSSGDIVACKKLPLDDLFFQWNKVYVLDTIQGALVKRIKKGSTEECVLIVSDNIKYDPFELHRSQINAVALVIGVIRLE